MFMNNPINSDWSVIYDQEFSNEEIREAIDFSDIMRTYGYKEESLVDFLPDKLKTGHRLFIAMNLNVSDLSIMAFSEKDKRISYIIKKRSSEL